MLHTTLALAHIKRPIRPMYGFSQATPQLVYLDSNWDRSVDIYPGMVLMQGATAETATLIDGTGQPLGLAALYVAPTYGIDEVADQGVNSMAVWVLGPDAIFEVDAPAFDTDETWTLNADGTDTYVHAQTTGDDRGKLTVAGASNASTNPVARLVKVNSASTITIAGLTTRVTS